MSKAKIGIAVAFTQTDMKRYLNNRGYCFTITEEDLKKDYNGRYDDSLATLFEEEYKKELIG